MKNNIIAATAADNAFVSFRFMTLAMKKVKMRQASDTDRPHFDII